MSLLARLVLESVVVLLVAHSSVALPRCARPDYSILISLINDNLVPRLRHKLLTANALHQLQSECFVLANVSTSNRHELFYHNHKHDII